MEFKLGPKIKLEKMPFWIKGLKVDEKKGIKFKVGIICFQRTASGVDGPGGRAGVPVDAVTITDRLE